MAGVEATDEIHVPSAAELRDGLRARIAELEMTVAVQRREIDDLRRQMASLHADATLRVSLARSQPEGSEQPQREGLCR